MTTIVIGAGGFVGGALVRRLQAEGQSVVPVGRGQAMPSLSGDVFYCAGLTADFRSRPHDTISAHVSLINDLLRDHTFDSLTYLSSTRVYQKAVTGRETESIPVDPADPSDLYNLSKLTGEAICLNDPRPTVRTVRLSNVFGPGSGENFLDTVIAAVRRDGRVHIGSGATGAKDYIAIDDVIDALLRVPDRASSRLLNLASGTTITNTVIGDLLIKHLGAEVTYGSDDLGIRFPDIDVTRMQGELGVACRPFQDAFADLLMATDESTGRVKS